MYTAHSTIGTQDYLVCRSDNLADLMYDVVHTHGMLNDPEPAIIKYLGRTIGTVNFGHWTGEGRDCFFTFPNGGKKLVTLSLDMKSVIEKV